MTGVFRKSKVKKVIACYLALMIFLEVTAPMSAYALTGGPTQPEFNSFTPIGTSDMVDLSSGDFNYNIPIMDVGGYPINLAYNSGVSMDQEASWVGLGWDLNVGQIARQMRGIPDDFDGDEMVYENHMKDNITVGANFGQFVTAFGVKEGETSPPKLSLSQGFGIKYNNYEGFAFSLSQGLSFQISNNLAVGVSMDASAADGVTVAPYLSLSSKFKDNEGKDNRLTTNVGIGLNNRKGVESVTLSASRSRQEANPFSNGDTGKSYNSGISSNRGSVGSSISFLDAAYTPFKRLGMTSNNYMFNLNIQGELYGLEPGGKFTGYRTQQGLKQSEKFKRERAFGYENSYKATDKDILDFNREKDKTFNVYTATLPVTNNTFDLYSIQGQGISGMYRPYKSQAGFVYDNQVIDDSSGGSLGVEIGAGGGFKLGVDISVTLGKSHTKPWRSNNAAIGSFEEIRNGIGLNPAYEKVYFKNIGGNHVDKDHTSLFKNNLGAYDPIRFGIGGGRLSRKAEAKFNRVGEPEIPFSGKVRRANRVSRNQPIQKLTRREAENYGYNTQFSPYSKRGKHDHHTSEIRITKDGGERYVYGRAAYNIIQKEATFNVSDRQGDCKTGLVPYFPGKDNSAENSNKGDEYFNRVTTPAFAHTYLLTSVLSSDYSDLTNNGPTDDDLGSYTKFVYDASKTVNKPYKWRVPFEKNHANYDEGLRSSDVDNKGNYIYGEKELLYIKKIETKTHIAIFDISLRKDGYGVDDENGGATSSTTSRMYKLNKISLYSKPEYLTKKEQAVPIKVAHFVYDYSLCPGVNNNFDEAADTENNESDNQGGKLTLKKVFFTYRTSKMGMYTPYKFSYRASPSTIAPGADDPENPKYNMKAYDTWGNYKPVNQNAGCGVQQALTNAEYPYVEQNKETADTYTAAWSLKSIELPSGATIEVQYESDDYQYVQDEEVMQMFKVIGVGNNPIPTNEAALKNEVLYNGSSHIKYLHIELPELLKGAHGQVLTGEEQIKSFKDKYIRHLINDKVAFRFLLNMAKPAEGNHHRFDYVSGYLEFGDPNDFHVATIAGKQYGILPIKQVRKGDGANGNNPVNPISKAGWNFGRQYLNRFVYTDATDEKTDNLEEIVKDILDVLPWMLDLFKSPNGQLIQRKIAHKFVSEKGWVRLMQPNRRKFGGGSRVKQIRMHDKWEVMTENDNDSRYKQYYGQTYTYENVDGSSSGVATYEPLGNKENPLVQPMFKEGDPGRFLAPEDQNWIEAPLGECYFPSPKVTYSRVSVENLERKGTFNGVEKKISRHATGKVVTEFFTSKDYPTIVDYTDLGRAHDKAPPLASLLQLQVREHLTLSQGFVVHTNDMNGKLKKQLVYGQDQIAPISGSEYSYDDRSTNVNLHFKANRGRLDNTVTTIDAKGNISKELVGVDYEVVHDFRENKVVTENAGLQVNVATIPYTVVVVVVPTPIPSYSRHENQFRSATTTKVIHSCGILREQLVFDAGSEITTKNLAWDAETGEVLLTETTNEYSDKYYSLNQPAYWVYDGMGQAARNIDLSWPVEWQYGTPNLYRMPNAVASTYLQEGDELWVSTDEIFTSDEDLEINDFKAYVVNIDNDKFSLITESGLYVKPDMLKKGRFKVSRSGYRNMQSASMASVTSVKNPIAGLTNLPDNMYTSTNWNDFRIINASAIEYSDTWPLQCECRLPNMQYTKDQKKEFYLNYENTEENSLIAYNPYIYNVKGNWRPSKSYAYLTGRNTSASAHTRNSGYFNSFSPFYKYSISNKSWTKNETAMIKKWQAASEVTQYSPFGFEVENKDALDRHSSALYGYNYRFPTAVASNTRYSELAYDGFEDYEINNCDQTAHFNFMESLEQHNVSIATGNAHSGKKSLRVAPGKKAKISKQIIKCDTIK